jgi:tetratricopeptide (TPR) repeat protein
MPQDRADVIRSALNRGQADAALQMLDAVLKSDPKDAEALNLRCRVYYAEERWDDAIGSCEQAVQIAQGNSSYHLWLGRAYGKKAQQLSLMAAYKMARLLRVEFEAAASLDPKNGEALSDLGEFYAQAPAIVGGGYGKAEAVARQLDGFSALRALELRAEIAEEKKDYAGAEKLLRARIATSNSAAQAWMDLGSFYERRERWDEMLAALKTGSEAAQDHGPALADGAAILMKAGREPKLAIEWMRAYLGSNALSEEAPAFVMHARIGVLLKQLGDAQGAQKEFDAARALAKDYAGLPEPKKAGH